MATSPFSNPKMPKIKGEFKNKIIHSSQYKSADDFKDKNVLIVGIGNSGCDIAVDAKNNDDVVIELVGPLGHKY